MEAAVVFSAAVAFAFLACSLICAMRAAKTDDEILWTMALALLLLAIAQFAGLLNRDEPDLVWIYLPRLAAFLLVARKIIRTGLAG